MPQGSKQWWTKVRGLLGEEIKKCNIPALQEEDGTWIIDARGKANLLSRTMHEKCTLREKEANRFTKLEQTATLQWELRMPMEEDAEKILANLKEDSGTGPDELPARILKMCARQLAKPIVMLTRRAIATGE